MVIVIGGIVSLIASALWTTYVSDFLCVAQPWLLTIGIDLVFVPLIVKNFRIFLLFRNISSLKITVISNWQLLLFVSILLIPDIVTMIVWSAVFIPHALQVETNPYAGYYWYSVCSSTSDKITTLPTLTLYDTAFVATLGVYKGVLLLSGIIVTYLLRKVPSAFNEGRYLGYAIYNLAFCLVLLLAIWQAVAPSQYLFATIAREVVILWAILISVGVIFVPKIYFVLTNRKSDLRGSIRQHGTRSAVDTDNVDTTNTTTGAGDQLPSLKLQAIEAENAQLREQLRDAMDALRGALKEEENQESSTSASVSKK